MQIVLKLHSRCNLACPYCYMYFLGEDASQSLPKRLPPAVIDALPDMINSYLSVDPNRTISICFHGGEPLLFGKKNFRMMMDQFRGRSMLGPRIRYSMQSNFVLLDREWLDILHKYDISLSTSLDGPPAVSERSRIDHRKRPVVDRIEDNIRLASSHPVCFSGIICVADPDANGADTVRYFAEHLHVDWFDMLLPDFTHDHIADAREWQQTQEGLTRFTCEAFDAWFDDYASSLRCRFFESLVGLMLGFRSTVDTVGSGRLPVVVVETDGRLEPHDLSRICLDFSRDTGETVSEGALDRIMQTEPFAFFANGRSQFASRCENCKHLAVCRGGHPVHRYSRQAGLNNVSVHCRCLYALIEHIQDRLVRAIQHTVTSDEERTSAKTFQTGSPERSIN